MSYLSRNDSSPRDTAAALLAMGRSILVCVLMQKQERLKNSSRTILSCLRPERPAETKATRISRCFTLLVSRVQSARTAWSGIINRRSVVVLTVLVVLLLTLLLKVLGRTSTSALES